MQTSTTKRLSYYRTSTGCWDGKEPLPRRCGEAREDVQGIPLTHKEGKEVGEILN